MFSPLIIIYIHIFTISITSLNSGRVEGIGRYMIMFLYLGMDMGVGGDGTANCIFELTAVQLSEHALALAAARCVSALNPPIVPSDPYTH